MARSLNEPYDPATPEGRAMASDLTRILVDLEDDLIARGVLPVAVVATPAHAETREAA